jgi:hypothetical protein
LTKAARPLKLLSEESFYPCHPNILPTSGGHTMFNVFTGQTADCSRLTRRSFVQVGGLATLGLTLADYFQLQQTARASGQAPLRGRAATQCILMWMQGGPSHLDMFDPKPDAPVEIRGEFGTVPTTMPGVRFSEHLPLLAEQMNHLAVVRGHDPRNGSHGVADHLMMTGHRFNAALAYPCFGSVIAKERGYQNGMLPFVQLGRAIDRRFNGGIAGFLGDQYNPFEVGEDPNAPVFRVRDLALADEAERARLDRRYQMLAEMDRLQVGSNAVAEIAPPVRARDEFYERAHGIITAPAARRAFNLDLEPAAVRDRYGRTTFGQSCLLARRLIEAGVQFVTVTDGGWDTHQNNFRALRERKLPWLDAGFSALLRDLSERGLLDSTLIVWFGDFGRTPKINPSAGRDHWSTAGTAVFAGGGVPGGQVVGATNELGEHVTDNPATPQDLAATIYTLLGVPLHTWYRTPDGRPIELVPEGRPIRAIAGA